MIPDILPDGNASSLPLEPSTQSPGGTSSQMSNTLDAEDSDPPTQHTKTKLLTYDEALDKVLQAATPLADEPLPLNAALGRILADDLLCPIDLPRFDNSAVDGFAICQEDLETLNATGEIVLPVSRTIGAGDTSGPALSQGETIRIFTGAKIPEGTVAIIMQEDSQAAGESVRLIGPAKPGQHIRRTGEEFQARDVGLPKGIHLNPAGIAFAATLGLAVLPVFQLPEVAVITTGAELVPPGQPLTESQIYESNSYGLRAALNNIGIEPISVQTVGDDPVQTLSAIQSVLESCDVLITTGGVSVGAFDVVKDAFAQCGVEQVFWGVAIKPGKPAYFGLRKRGSEQNQAVFGLPGNPQSVLVTFHLLARPYLLKNSGHSTPTPAKLKARLTTSVKHKPGRQEFVPAVLTADENGLSIAPITGQGSHMLGGLAKANALIDVPADATELIASETVTAIPYGQVGL